MREDKQIENREVQSFLVPPVTTPVGGDYGVENKAQVSPADQQGPRPHLKASRILYTKKAIYPQCGATIKAALKKKKKSTIISFCIIFTCFTCSFWLRTIVRLMSCAVCKGNSNTTVLMHIEQDQTLKTAREGNQAIRKSGNTHTRYFNSSTVNNTTLQCSPNI